MTTRKRESGHDLVPGVISMDEIYTLDEARRRLRWSDSALRAARRSGLRLWTCGRRKYVSGQELARFLESQNRRDADGDP